MKKIYLLLCIVIFILNTARAQMGMWTWMSGDSAANALAVGTLGSSSVNNHPPNLYEALSWKDKQGNFWLYGGFTVNTDLVYNNTELWKFDPSTKAWTWMKGGVWDPLYGAKGVVNTANTPGDRTYSCPAWVDTAGDLWLFGGAGHGDDLWRYTIASNTWMWVSGDTTGNKASVHGDFQIATSQTTPGNRYSTTSAWTDAQNNLWLFGGFGAEDDSAFGGLGDLWRYNISSGEWAWMKGSPLINPSPVYNSPVATDIPTSEPGERFTYTNWTDTAGNFWLLGGFDYNESFSARNDVWRYNLGDGTWAWMAGPNTPADVGNYNATCAFNNLNTPFSRFDNSSSATDGCGKFWTFGGAGVDPFSPGYFNDLWVFNVDLLQWNLVKGYGQQPGIYGQKGVAAAANIPAPRSGAVAWWGNDNNFYMFGGEDGSQLHADMWVFTPDTNCVPTCHGVIPPPPPPPTLPVAGFQVNQRTLCGSYCVNFNDTSTNETSRKWIFSGVPDSISTDPAPHVCYTNEGTYSVRLVAYNSNGQDSVTMGNYITVVPLPPVPALKTQGDTMMYFSPDPSYVAIQWYNEATLLAGQTDTFLVITASGNYRVVITANNGCTVELGILMTVPTGIKEYVNDHAVVLSPNPAGDKLKINPAGAEDKLRIQKIDIYDVLGNLSYSLSFGEGRGEAEIDISNLAPGIYFLQMHCQNGAEVLKFIKE